jgi:hypothetical protein
MMEGGRPVLGKFSLKPGSQLGIGARKVQVVQDRPDIEPGTPGEHGHPARGKQLLHDSARLPLVSSHRGALGDIEDVEQVVAHPTSLCG